MKTNRFLQIACMSGLMLMGVCTESFAAMNGEQVSDTIKVEKKRKAHSMPDVQPKYPGGMMECMKFLAKNIKYPEEAVKNKVEGRVIIQMVVKKDGSIANAKVVRSIDPLLDKEALRVINLMPKWKPGKNQGEAVRVRYTMPVMFKLK